MSIVRFQASYTNQGVTFSPGQEWEMVDKYESLLKDPCSDCPPKITMFYRFKYIDDKIYTAPEDVVVIIDNHTSNNRTLTTQEEKWDRKVTRDQIKLIYEKEDYVRAAKEFQGIDIAAKERQDQADYEFNFPLSAYLEKRSYE
jgi:hypothetical protein